MNITKILFAVSLLCVSKLSMAAPKTQPQQDNKHSANTPNKSLEGNELQQVSYAIGVKTVENFKQNHIEIDFNQFWQGIQDTLAKQSKISKDQIDTIMIKFQESQQEKAHKLNEAISQQNLKLAKEFFATNKNKENVVTLPSGLQYKINHNGTGLKPSNDDSVLINYRGTLLDGTEFDSSYSRNTPATLKLSSVIPGFREALSLMSPGAKWTVFIPPALGYGDHGAGGLIKGNAALIFDIELIEIAANKPAEKVVNPA